MTVHVVQITFALTADNLCIDRSQWKGCLRSMERLSAVNEQSASALTAVKTTLTVVNAKVVCSRLQTTFPLTTVNAEVVCCPCIGRTWLHTAQRTACVTSGAIACICCIEDIQSLVMACWFDAATEEATEEVGVESSGVLLLLLLLLRVRVAPCTRCISCKRSTMSR